jgi:microcystin-dependent protein
MVNSFTYTTNKNIIKPAFNNTGWDVPLNQNFDMIDAALGATQAMNLQGNLLTDILLTKTWPLDPGGVLANASCIPMRLALTGAVTQNTYIHVPAATNGLWVVSNNTTSASGFNVFFGGSATQILVSRNQSTLIWCDGGGALLLGSSGITSATFAVGDYKHSAAPAAQSGWLLCNGQAVPRTTYSALFAAIGGYYGVGDGSTTFNVPNLIGRVLSHADQNQGVTPGVNFAQAGGVSAVTLDISQIPYHDHGGGNHLHGAYQAAHQHGIGGILSNQNHAPGAQYGPSWQFQTVYSDWQQPAVTIGYSGNTIGGQGSNGGHTNVQPSLGCYIFIYAGV